MSLTSILKEYKLSHQVTGLYIMRLFLDLSRGMVGLFLPVYLFLQLGESINAVILFYLIGFFLFCVTVTFGAKAMSVIGMKRSVILGIIFLAAFYTAMLVFQDHVWWFVSAALLSQLLFRDFFWIPYHTELAELTDRKHRGSQISVLMALTEVMSVIGPILAGWLVMTNNFEMYFAIVVLLTLAAAVPVLRLPVVKETFSWGYWQTWRHVFKKKNHSMVSAFFADGAQSIVGVVIWPLFIYQILEGDFLEMGIIGSLVVVVTIVLRLAAGHLTDHMKKARMIHAGSVLFSLGWVLKAFAATAMHIFLASAFHNFAAILVRTPFDTLVYERMADQGHYIDEYSVLREIASTGGRVLMLIALSVLVAAFGLTIAFYLAALFALLMNALNKKQTQTV